MTRYEKIEHVLAALLGWYMVWVASMATPPSWTLYQETRETIFLFASVTFPLMAIASLGLSAGAIYTAFFKKAP